VVFASRFEDQRLWRIDGDPVPITPEPEIPAGLRYADGTLGEAWGIWVRERHHDGGEPANELVRIPLDGSSEPQVVAAGHDFYAAPRLSPDGTRLAFLTWDHPDMPWNGTTLRVAPVAADGSVGDARAVAGGRGESVFGPVWSPGGELHFSSDRSGWWNPYRLDEEGRAVPVLEIDGDAGVPAWLMGRGRMAFLDDGTLAVVTASPEGTRITLVAPDGAARPLAAPAPAIDSFIAAAGRHLYLVAGAPDRHPSLVRVDAVSGDAEILATAGGPDLDPAYLSIPERFAFDTPDGPAYAYHYPPKNPGADAPAGERPPLIVVSHGGPTSATSPSLSPAIQFWTSRGFAVVDVDYGGSTGYGRRYWERLEGTWGEVDVRDCALAARHLVDRGLADGERLAIRGGSAGGFTTLAALAFRDEFAAGASHFGVADLELLARHTHKFESRYLDWLVGPLPEAADLYHARSPIHHAGGITSPVILFQGLDDRIVPPEQARLMAAELEAGGVPVRLVEIEGEGHGFRKAENQIMVLEAELTFYGEVFGFEPAD
jgi:dipeptidyl aminopeptidase/acylaminoacyl peptidase